MTYNTSLLARKDERFDHACATIDWWKSRHELRRETDGLLRRNVDDRAARPFAKEDGVFSQTLVLQVNAVRLVVCGTVRFPAKRPIRLSKPQHQK